MAAAYGQAWGLEKCCLLIGSYLEAHGQDCHSLPDFQPVCRSSRRFACRISGVYTEFQLIADVDIYYRLGQFTDYNLRIVIHRKPNRDL